MDSFIEVGIEKTAEKLRRKYNTHQENAEIE